MIRSSTLILLTAFATACIGTPPGSDTDATRPSADAGEDVPQPDTDASAEMGPDSSDACTPGTCDGLAVCGMADDGCGGVLDCEPCSEASSIFVNRTDIVMLRGETYPVAWALRDDENNRIPDTRLNWTSDEDAIATVNQEGEVTAVTTGTTRVVVSSDDADVSPVEIAITVENGWRDVAVGVSHTCGLTTSGRAYCWGNGRTLALGASGMGSHPEPHRVDRDNQEYAEIAVGQNHSCAIAAGGGTVRCWGQAANGQLGNNDQSRRPVPVTLPRQEPYAGLETGLFHTCVSDAGKNPMCWGANGEGQSAPVVGDPIRPTEILMTPPLTDVDGGWRFTCGVSDNDGTLRCWGHDANGELADGEEDGSPRTAVTATIDDTTLTLTEVSAFDGHACALSADGRIVCWGFNDVGQVTPDGETPVHAPKAPFADEVFRGVEAGARHSCAILDDQRTIRCWGANEVATNDYTTVGVLGTTDASATQNDIVFGHNVLAISCGWQHNCVLLNDDTIRCWGENQDGQLGNGQTADSATPVIVGVPPE